MFERLFVCLSLSSMSIYLFLCLTSQLSYHGVCFRKTLFFFGYELNSDELIPLGLEAPCWPHIGHLDTGCLVIVGPMLIISGPKLFI